MSSNMISRGYNAMGTKVRQIQDAKTMEKAVMEKCKKKGIDVPDYEFLELIGKGTYGRVYKWCDSCI
jgi:hypothetical protein